MKAPGLEALERIIEQALLACGLARLEPSGHPLLCGAGVDTDALQEEASGDGLSRAKEWLKTRFARSYRSLVGIGRSL
jgi:hypothetical protein